MPILWIIVAIIIGAGTGFGLTQFKNKTRQADHQKQLEKTRQQADKILKEARSEAQSNLDKAQSDIDKRRQELNQFSDRLEAREKKLDDKQEKFDQSQESHRQEVEDLNQAKDKIYEIRQQQEEKLAKIAKLTKKEAADKLYQMVEKNTQADLKDLIAKLQTEAKAEAEDNARAILISAMERLASETTLKELLQLSRLIQKISKVELLVKRGATFKLCRKSRGLTYWLMILPELLS